MRASCILNVEMMLLRLKIGLGTALTHFSN
jgi:hypothetical protein